MGVFGATVKLAGTPITGFKLADYPYVPTGGEIVIGHKYSYKGVEDTETVGRIFYDPVKVNYSLILKKESLDSAKARRDAEVGPTQENVSYDPAETQAKTAYSTYRINVNTVVSDFETANKGFDFFMSIPTLNGPTYQAVQPDGTTTVEVRMTRQINHVYDVQLRRESLTHAKTGGTPEYDPALDEPKHYENGVTGEEINLQNKYGTYYSDQGQGFHWHESLPEILTIPAEGTVSGMVGFYRDTN